MHSNNYASSLLLRKHFSERIRTVIIVSFLLCSTKCIRQEGMHTDSKSSAEYFLICSNSNKEIIMSLHGKIKTGCWVIFYPTPHLHIFIVPKIQYCMMYLRIIISYFDSSARMWLLLFYCYTNKWVTGFAKRDLPHTSNLLTLTVHNLGLSIDLNFC